MKETSQSLLQIYTHNPTDMTAIELAEITDFLNSEADCAEASTASLNHLTHKTEFRMALIYKYSHLQLKKKKKKKHSPLASVFSFPFREKKKKECNLWKLLTEEAGSLGYPYLFARSYKCILESKQWKGY